jgi:hypothetical protein
MTAEQNTGHSTHAEPDPTTTTTPPEHAPSAALQRLIDDLVAERHRPVPPPPPPVHDVARARAVLADALLPARPRPKRPEGRP